MTALDIGESVLGLPETTRRHFIGSLTIIVGQEPTEYGLRWHLSISHPLRYPRWDEIKAMRMRFIPQNVTVAMFLPGEKRYVNIHPNCFHLWETQEP